ncbi:hypothetical protein XELAEV_18024716mg [Xenopus laevis]|uniref:Uncharacterized protein n=1 Tax=Xenopus laevis TaxID=8355 RepID=A0A974HLL8_XENLA|nr:hypothetical protein XELAEV_18024716mg [Xenopus laevis]
MLYTCRQNQTYKLCYSNVVSKLPMACNNVRQSARLKSLNIMRYKLKSFLVCAWHLRLIAAFNVNVVAKVHRKASSYPPADGHTRIDVMAAPCSSVCSADNQASHGLCQCSSAHCGASSLIAVSCSIGACRQNNTGQAGLLGSPLLVTYTHLLALFLRGTSRQNM